MGKAGVVRDREVAFHVGKGQRQTPEALQDGITGDLQALAPYEALEPAQIPERHVPEHVQPNLHLV